MAAIQTVRLRHEVEIEVPAGRVWAVLTDPANIVRYAGGIEGAEVTSRPNGDDLTGARLELVTKSGNLLKARVLEARHERRLVVEDERGVRAMWTIEPSGNGRIRLGNTVEGPIPVERATQYRYDCDVKFQALRAILETPS